MRLRKPCAGLLGAQRPITHEKRILEHLEDLGSSWLRQPGKLLRSGDEVTHSLDDVERELGLGN